MRTQPVLTTLAAALLFLPAPMAVLRGLHGPGRLGGGSAGVEAGPAAPAGPALPAKHVDTSMPAVTGARIRVRAGENLQSALDRARPGDEVALERGAVFTGNFILPAKSQTSEPKWIIVTTQSPSAGISPLGKRVDPKTSKNIARIVSNNSAPALKAAPGAGYYRLMLLEVTIAPSVLENYGMVRLGEGNETSLEQLPHNVIIDRCYVHGLPAAGVRRGIALNCADSAVIDSYISECHETGADSQAICCWNGPGPFEISNNYLEASGENVMFGGADPGINGLIPSDIDFTKNYCTKPVEWRQPVAGGKRWAVKNLFELKNAARVLIEDNVFENNWLQAQTGYAVLFKSVDQEGHAPWSVTQDVTFRNNVVRHTSSGVNIQGRDSHGGSGQTSRIAIENNLFEDVNGDRWGGEGCFLKMSDAEDVLVDHNTVANSGSIVIVYGPQSGCFAFTNNIVRNNAYGIKGDSAASGLPTLTRYFSSYRVDGNVIAGGTPSAYPPGNCFPPAEALKTAFKRPALSQSMCRSPDGRPAGCDLRIPEATAEEGAPR